jgi:hypothetical protein
MKEIPGVSHDVVTYVQSFMIVFLERYVGLHPAWARARHNVLRLKVPHLRNVRTPYFCDVKGIKRKN